MSASVGAVFCVANLEHLLHDLLDCRQRVELAPLYFVEQTPQLRIVRDRALQMSLRATRCDGEHLTGEILASPLLESSFPLEMCPAHCSLRPEPRPAPAT